MDDLDIPELETETLNKIVDGLSTEPCVLGIVVIVLVFAWLLSRNYKHIEKMEEARIKQTLEIMSTAKNNEH